jgi:hypothetical protein
MNSSALRDASDVRPGFYLRPGLYWVKLGTWTVGRYRAEGGKEWWQLPEADGCYVTSELDDIGPRLEPPRP